MDLVSVIIPCHNVSSYVDNYSWIFEQTYPELEVVLVDDCSTDDTWQKLQVFKQQYADKRIIVAHNEQNLGVAATRNRGFALSSGQYVCFWDADDRAYPQFVEKMLAKLKQEQADFVYCAHNILNQKGGERFHPIRDELLAVQNDLNLLKQKVFCFYAVPWNKMVRRDFIQKYDIKFPLVVLHEDDCWTTQLVLNAKKIVFINEPYYQYYTGNNSSIVHRYTKNDKRELGYWQLMQFSIDYLNKLGLASLMYSEWNKYFLYYVLHRYQVIVSEDGQDQFFLRVRDFCRQNNVALTAKDLPIAYRVPVYLLLPNIGHFAEKRKELKQAYSCGQELLPDIRKLSAFVKLAEAHLDDSK